MSVPSNLNKIVYNGNGVTTSWGFTFPVILSTDIEVILTDTTGIDGDPLSSNYTVDVSNGTVTYPTSGSPLPSGWKITIIRVEPITQLTTLSTQGAFSAANIEDALDKLTMIAQQHDEQFSRVPQFPVSQTPTSQDTTDFINTVAGYATAAAASAASAAFTATPTVVVKTADYSILAADFGKILVMNSASAHTFTLPAISTNGILFIKNIGVGVCTITASGSDTTEVSTLYQNQSCILTVDITNTKWRDVVNSNQANTVSLNMIVDGGGTAITTGVKLDVYIPFACTILEATVLADQSGSIVFDVWNDSYANYPPTVADTITASAKPTLSSATKAQDSTLTGWTKTLAAGSSLRINVDSVSTVTRVDLHLKLRKT